MNTLLLDTVAWDLCLDAFGNMAVASNPYSLAQDAASAIRMFQGEYWYDTTKGIPYKTRVLSKTPPIELVKALNVSAALTVPEVVAAQCYISGISNRTLAGQVQVTDSTGATATAGFIQ